jgi:hypothetical protein
VSEQAEQRRRPPDPAGTQPKVDRGALERAPHDGQLALSPGGAGAHIDLARATPAALAAAPAQAATPAAPARASAGEPPHAARFQFLFGALGALGVAAIALAAMLISTPAKAPAPPWSAWHPSSDGIDPAQQIADHVAPRYQLDNGRQIVQITGGPPAVRGQPLTVGIFKSGQSPARLEGNSVLFQMCGGGSDCSIKQGTPSLERGLLLYREALELALYTFRYVSGVEQVIVTIPPPPPGSLAAAGAQAAGKTAAAGRTGTSAAGAGTAGTGTTGASSTAGSATSATATRARHALMFRSQDLASELERPLTASLSAITPRVSQMNRSPDAALVMRLTGPLLYDFAISEVAQGESVMLLSPPTS